MKNISLVLTTLFIGCSTIQEKPSSNVAMPLPVRELSQAEKNLIVSEEWLNEKSQAIGVQKTESGLLYKKITHTNNCQPAPNSHVTLHYSVSIAKESGPFDSSFMRGVPGTFPINQMVPAWVEGLPLMREGEMWEFYVHPKLAYGEGGSGDLVKPNTALVFMVKLITVYECQ